MYVDSQSQRPRTVPKRMRPGHCVTFRIASVLFIRKIKRYSHVGDSQGNERRKESAHHSRITSSIRSPPKGWEGHRFLEWRQHGSLSRQEIVERGNIHAPIHPATHLLCDRIIRPVGPTDVALCPLCCVLVCQPRWPSVVCCLSVSLSLVV